MKTYRWFSRLPFAAGLALAMPRAGADGKPLEYFRIDLNDGRTLKNVVVKSYDPKTEKILLIADGKAMSVPLAQFPAPVHAELKAVPASGSTISTITFPPPPVAAPRSTNAPLPPVIVQPSPPPPPARIYRPTVPKKPAPAAQPAHPELATDDFPAHQDAARTHADRFYRYELQLGSNNIRVTTLEFKLEVPQEVSGWTGRYRTTGKAFIEYYDSAGGSYRRTTSEFEILTEQKPNEPIKVVDFTRKN